MPSNQSTVRKRPVIPALEGRPLFETQPKGWLLMAEVMQVLELSQRQVQRLQTEKRLSNLASLWQSGHRPITLYDIREVMAIKKELDVRRAKREQRDLVLRKAGEMSRRSSKPPAERESAKVSAMTFLLSKALELFEASQNRAELTGKLLLTVDESCELGFMESYLRRQVRAGNLRNYGTVNRYLFSRFDLVALVGGDFGKESAGGKVRGSLSDREIVGVVR